MAEFDQYAGDYTELHRRNIAISGEQPDYFARYKIKELRRRWSRMGQGDPADILDFGCGVGASLPHLAELFPQSRLTGIDVSANSLLLAAKRVRSGVTLKIYDGEDIDLPHASFDLIFSACVFHHIPPAARSGLLRQLRNLLRPGGVLAIFEHNPLNPVTRYIVATCPFDEHAVLASSAQMIRLQRAAGFSFVGATFTGFFPARLAAFRPLEAWLGSVPMGAQYYTLARA